MRSVQTACLNTQICHADTHAAQGRIFREAFIAKLALLLRGTVAAPPERFGETLADEHIRGGQSLFPARLRVHV